jgi:polyhydroxyalkanoate synthesis regulator phasin
MSTARDRAEELLANLQKRARDFLSAEEGLVRTVRDMIDDAGWSPDEAKKRLEELVGRIKANNVWERLFNNDNLVVALNDYRGEVEKKAKELLQSLPVASKAEVAELQAQVKKLEKQLAALSAKLAQ